MPSLRLSSGVVIIAVAIGLHGCASTPVDVAKRSADHAGLFGRVPAELINECTSKLNNKSFGDLSTASWKFLGPLAPDDRLACFYGVYGGLLKQFQHAYYSARVEQTSGWPGGVGVQTIYWCKIAIEAETGKSALVSHQVGLVATQLEANEGRDCGLPMVRAKNIIEKALDGAKSASPKP